MQCSIAPVFFPCKFLRVNDKELQDTSVVMTIMTKVKIIITKMDAVRETRKKNDGAELSSCHTFL